MQDVHDGVVNGDVQASYAYGLCFGRVRRALKDRRF